MMRQANAALRLLLRMQQARRKLEADDTARDRAAWTEHCATSLMAEALAACPHPGPLPKGEGGEGKDEGTPSPLPLGEGQGEGTAAADLVAAAERYATVYPERAAAIRRTGRLPHDEVRYFDPPEAALARVLIHAHTPALRALDRTPPEASAA